MQSAPKRIVLSGGGTAGHITPLLAVARELKRTYPSASLVYIGERNGKFSHVAERGQVFDEIRLIPAGKFRRYHGQSLLSKLLDSKTMLLNVRDFFRFLAGAAHSVWLVGRLKPDVMFLKGGFVCVPVALAARLYKVPYITHDSDIMPGLANRLAARWARYHATALDPKYYPYPKETVREVGVPIDEHFQPVDPKQQREFKKELGLNPDDLMLYVTGGSHGARRLNKALVQVLPQIIEKYPRLQLVHQIGAGNENQYSQVPDRYKNKVTYFGVTAEQHRYSAAADVIVTRAGATALSELAVQGKACIIVPNPLLTGGHQLKNAEVYEQKGAAVVLQESELKDNPASLYDAIAELLEDFAKRQHLANALQSTQKGKQAAHEIARLILEVAE